MTNFKEFLKAQLEDPEIRAEWDALQPERAIAQATIETQQKKGLSQKKHTVEKLPAAEN